MTISQALYLLELLGFLREDPANLPIEIRVNLEFALAKSLESLGYVLDIKRGEKPS